MLNIPELDDMICQQLDTRSLAQCARVCKSWHTVAVSRLWRDLTWLSKTSMTCIRAFRLLVLEDFNVEQGQKLGCRGYTTEQPSLITLSKYGHWIQLLPDPKNLRKILTDARAGQEKDSAAYRLLFHLFKRCSPDVQVQSFSLCKNDLNLPPDIPRKQMIDFVLPRLRHLRIQASATIHHTNASKLMGLLDQCGAMLRKLDLDFNITGDPEANDALKEGPTENDPGRWTSLKELSLKDWGLKADTEVFWPWFFRRCSQVQKLELDKCSGSPEFLRQAMLTYMPRLGQFTLGVTEWVDQIQEHKVAALLSGSNGWKKVTMGGGAKSGSVAMGSLGKHCSTLETLDLNGYRGQSTDEIVNVLRSCTKLCSFSNLNKYFKLDAKVFTDMDPNTGVLKPWKCEETLKELRIRITGIPRSGVMGGGGDEGASIGQAREIQSGVYGRLARLTNLESLWLGWRAFGNDGDDSNYLEMTLESGLHKLSGLKSLKSLCFQSIPTKIGIVEVLWMVENWPELREIDGLYGDGQNSNAVGLLRMYHPHLSVGNAIYPLRRTCAT